MFRRTLVATVTIFVLTGCGSTVPPAAIPTTVTPTQSPSVAPAPTSTSAPASQSAIPTSSSAGVAVPPGTIAFMKADPDGSEHYFTIHTDGTNQHALFSTQGCACLAWSPDRTEIWAVSETDHGTAALMTLQPDGSDVEVHEPSIPTLSLVAGAATADGSVIAFNAWDDTEPDRNGIWVGSPDLTNLRQVTQLSEDASSGATLPLGITPDGGNIVFFEETGSEGIVTHAGDLYVVDADGENLRQLNDDSLHLSMVEGMPATLSPDGERAAFAAFEGDSEGGRSAVFVVRLDGGEAERITELTAGVWSAAWAPVGELITFASWTGTTSTVSVVNADGSGRRDLSAENDSVGFGSWSTDGKHLLVSRGRDEARRDLWVIDLEGNYVGQVTHEPADYVIYAWGPGDKP